MGINQAIVLCGGKGTRLGERSLNVPKPLVSVGGRPVLDHIIDALERAGISEFILAAGHLGEEIARYYSENPRLGSHIDVVVEPSPQGTAGALRYVAEKLKGTFILAYGDVFIDFDVRGLIESHERSKAMGTLLVRASDHPWDSHLIDQTEDGRILRFIDQREPGRLYRNVANAALYVLSRRIINYIPNDRASDFGADIFPTVLRSGGILHTHLLPEEGFVKDMGTPERLVAVDEYLAERTLARKASTERRSVSTVLLDRDGVLNVDSQLIDCEEKLKLLPGAGEAIAILNRKGIRCFVVTNQPVVARGMCTEETLARIHARLLREIADSGGSIEAVYYCPHHPETHHREGIPGLRRACRCRKPAPGLIFQAQRDHGFDLAGAVMVGDRTVDLRAGWSAGIRSVLIGTENGQNVEARGVQPHARFPSLLAFAKAIATDGVSVE